MIDRENLQKLCRNQVQVLSKYGSHRLRLIYMLGLCALILLLLIPTFFHHKKVVSNALHNFAHQKNYRSALEENLSKLRHLQAIPLAPARPHNVLTQHHEVKFSKMLQLRQHAPTRMYDLGILNLSTSSHHSSSTFLDKSNYTRFVNQSSHAPLVLASKLKHPRFTVPQGEFIHAVLETAIDSDLPGMIRAVIARPVYSYLGDRLLIPEGSRLIGQYSSQTLQGINRVMVIWQRILLPNAVSIQIDSPASDALGQAGFMADQVNTHFFQRFGEASLLSLLGTASANWGVNDDADNASQRYRTAISQSFQANASRALNHTLSIKPTLRIHQGAQVIVFVARDLDFYTILKKAHHD